MKTGGLILWNATVLCDMSKTSWKIERRFGEAFTLPVIPYGAMVEYHPISAKDQSRLHQFDEKGLPGTFLGCALFADGIWKDFGCRHGGAGNFGRVRKPCSNTECQGKTHAKEW